MTDEQSSHYPAIDRALFLFKRRLGLNPIIEIEEKSNLRSTPSISDSEEGEVSSVDSLQSADSLEFKSQSFQGLKAIGVEIAEEIEEEDDSILGSDNPEPQVVPIPHPPPTLPIALTPPTIIDLKENLNAFLDDHAKDPLEIPYNFQLAVKLSQRRWSCENLLSKKSISLQYLPSRYPLYKQVKNPEIYDIDERYRLAIFSHSLTRWKKLIARKKSMKKLLQHIRISLWTLSRSRRFIPIRQQVHCVERFGKDRLAQLYNKWRLARNVMTAIIDNYLADGISDGISVNENDEEEG